MSDFLEDKKREIGARLEELRPLVEEYQRLEAAAAALAGVQPGVGGGAARRAGARGRSGAARRTGATANGSSPGRGRPKGSGTRSKQALKLVRDKPGITIPELAEAMDIKQNYLYRVLPELQKDGLVRKEGRGWHPLEAA
jgi:hypothetical protein